MHTTLLLLQSDVRVPGKAAAEFGQMDPNGLAMTIIAMGVVFISLILLYLAFNTLLNCIMWILKNVFAKAAPKKLHLKKLKISPAKHLQPYRLLYICIVNNYKVWKKL